ncbi:hypothetical protein KBB49_02175 [Candidatus Saccharibacteria bacterium]|nr:hypothetical protein [Candidatus Saccharibacteria bacterium]
MFVNDLPTTVEQYPHAAEVAFARLEEAVNMVLPGSDCHDRYLGAEAVGLAVVIAKDLNEPNIYSPFDPDSIDRVSFTANNRLKHPGVWTPLETDATTLGGVLPEGMGRFVGFALAKINTLTYPDSGESSFREEEVKIGPGRVGLAGARRTMGGLMVFSGLWEVHDHALNEILIDEIVNENRAFPDTRTVDELAGKVEATIGAIQLLHAGSKASQLTRSEVAELLAIIG